MRSPRLFLLSLLTAICTVTCGQASPPAKNVFEMKQRCQELGKAQEDAIKICYSLKLNTCLAHIVRYPNDSVRDTEYSVADLTTGRTLASYCWWTRKEPALNACLLFESDEKKAGEYVVGAQAEMEKLMGTCAQ